MIQVRGVRKRYREVVALDGVDLEVTAGEIVAILGPNGAGKTTLIEIMEGFQRPDSGDVLVLGTDPSRADRDFRERVGLMLQECEPESYLSVAELLSLYLSYYPNPRSVPELLRLVGLEQKADARIRTLSGGQRRRLDMAVALTGRPVLLFMDEPTTGFDPEARQLAWEVVRSLREEGTTIVLTTHYLEEAESLADRVIVLAAGRIRAQGPPSTIGSRRDCWSRISFRPVVALEPSDLPTRVKVEQGMWVVVTDAPTSALASLTSWAVDRGVELDGLTVSRPSLQDAYLELIR
jgi:ABC-2 type transport system ATP-binding protein